MLFLATNGTTANDQPQGKHSEPRSSSLRARVRTTPERGSTSRSLSRTSDPGALREVTSPTVAKWERKLQRVREKRLAVLIEKDNLPDEWFGQGCLGVSIEDDLRHYRDLAAFALAAIRKAEIDEIARELLAQLDEVPELIEEFRSWPEIVAELRAHGPPLDDRTPRELITVPTHGANAPPVEVCLMPNNNGGPPT